MLIYTHSAPWKLITAYWICVAAKKWTAYLEETMTTRITIKDNETDGATFTEANLSATGNTLTIEAGGERGFVIQLPLEAVKAVIAGEEHG